MCNPMLIIGGLTAALGIGSAVSGYEGQKQAYAANQQAANYTFANQTNTENLKKVQVDQRTSENTFDTAIAEAKARGQIAASAGEQGLGSSSIVQALNADMFGLGRESSIEAANDTNTRVQLANEQQGYEIQRQARINSVPQASPLSLVLGIGQAVVGGAGAYHSAGGKF